MGWEAMCKRNLPHQVSTQKMLGPPPHPEQHQVAHLSAFLAALGMVEGALVKFKPVPERGLFFLRTSFFTTLFSPNGNK